MLRKMTLRTIVSTAFMTLILLFIFFNFTMIAGVSSGVVNFHADVRSGVDPLTVQFTDDTSYHIDTWNWDFGDGITDHAQNPVHTYTSSGNYTVSLTVSTIINGSRSQIGSEVKSDYIHVYPNASGYTPEINSGAGPTPIMTATPIAGSVSIIPGTVETPPSGTVIPATSLPAPKASANTGSLGGINLSEDAIQLALAAAIAVVIAAMIIYFFSNLGKHPGERNAAKKPDARPPTPPKSPKSQDKSRPEKSKSPKPLKKSEDISQDYIYGLVIGQGEKPGEQPPAPPQNEYKKIK